MSKPWPYKAEFTAFHKQHGRKYFTPIWNSGLEAEMMDPSLEDEWRAWSAYRRYSWGNLSDWCVDGMPAQNGQLKPRPLTHAKIGEILGISSQRMSKACTFLRSKGYLREHIYIYPEDKSPSESTELTDASCLLQGESFAFSSHRSMFLSQNIKTAQMLSDAEAARKVANDVIRKINYEVLTSYRAALREKQKQETQQNQQTNTDSENYPPSTTLVRTCAQSNDEQGEQKENSESPYTTEHDPDSNAVQSSLHNRPNGGVRIPKPVTPNVSNGPLPPPLKPLNIKGKSEGGTTTTDPKFPESSSSSSPAPQVPFEFKTNLTVAFATAGKPLPVKAQIAAAFYLVGDRWIDFLAWLPNADEFRRLEHPGGLPTLIEFFLSTDASQPPQKRPATRQEKSREEFLRGMDAIDQIKGRKRNAM